MLGLVGADCWGEVAWWGNRLAAFLLHPQLGLVQGSAVLSILSTARRASRGAGKLETKERIIRALAQHRVPAGKSSFPYQDP